MSGPAGDVLVLFGATGDLSRKMLFPALYRLSARGELTVPVVGVARTDLDIDQVRSHVADSVRSALGEEVDKAALESLLQHLHLVAGDFADPGTFNRLAELIDPNGLAVHYLAVPPDLFGTVADGLAGAGLAERARLVVEKPFGRDLASARQLNARLRRHYDEDRLYRVDHYLGKEPVEDLLVLRFANTMFEPLWSRNWVERVEITMGEDFDVADRGSFYDSVGTVRDVVQNHLLQLMAYLMMETPDSDSAKDQRDAKGRLFRAIRTIDPVTVVRGQYDGYRQTSGVAAGSTTETYVAMTVYVDNWRWVGVPVFLRAGKALPLTVLDVVLVLRAPPCALFVGPGQEPPPPNRIRLRMQPDAGVTLALLAKRPGGGDIPTELPVSVNFRTVLGPVHAPYERILADALAGDPTHFARMDNLEEAWRVVGPVLTMNSAPLAYAKGSWGPSAADKMPREHGWQTLPDPADH